MMEHIVALKLYSNRWRIKGAATTPMKKTQIDDAERTCKATAKRKP